MNNNILISIIIPVYNVEKFLPECLDSIVEQDFPADEYEIICVNDGSPDNSLQVIENYAKKYSNIRIVNKKNGGVSSARNEGTKTAIGKYIWYVDSDDIIAPDSLSTLKKELNENNYPDKISFKFTRFNFSDNQCLTDTLNNIDYSASSFNKHAVWTSIFLKDILVKKNLAQKPVDNNLQFAEDTLLSFYFRLYESSSISIDKTLYLYRNNQSSATNNRSLKKDIKKATDYVTLVSCIKNEFDNYDSEQFNTSKENIANDLMCFLWVAMESLACLPFIYRKKLIKKAKTEHIYPISIPDDYSISKENMLKWAYGRTKTEKYLNCHSHTRQGFFMLCLYYTPIRFKTALKRFLKK